LTTAGVDGAGAEETCLTFEIVRRASTLAEEPSVFVERLAISQVDVRSATFEVWEQSEATTRRLESMGRAVPGPRPQIVVELSEPAVAELRRATELYRRSSPPHHLRIARAGFEPFQPRIVVAFKGPTFVVPVSGPEEATKKIPMFAGACE
jgi:hypothetical protein